MSDKPLLLLPQDGRPAIVHSIASSRDSGECCVQNAREGITLGVGRGGPTGHDWITFSPEEAEEFARAIVLAVRCSRGIQPDPTEVERLAP